MKKCVLLILLLFVTTSCKTSEAIYNNMYIASIGFEKTENGYKGYFYLPSSVEVGNTLPSQSDEPASLAIMEEETIVDVFQGFELTSFLRMNLKHISTIILHESMLNKDSIEEFIQYVKNSNYFEYNFYFMVTKDKLEDIYKVENPNQESVIRTILSEPIATTYTYGAAKPLHFLNFCRDYYEGKVVSIALLESTNIWKEDKDSVISKGVAFVSQESNLLLTYEEEDFMIIQSKKQLEISTPNVKGTLKDYKWNIEYNKEHTKIKIKTKYEIIRSDVIDSKAYLEEVFKNRMEELITKYESRIDFLNLKYYNAENKNILIEVKFIYEK